MFFILLSCRGYFETTEEIDTFLDEVTNQWWHLEDEGSNLYLERDGQSNGGYLWIDYVYGPYCLVEYNVDGGEWQYESDGKIHVFYENNSYEINIKDNPDRPECWKLTSHIIYTDVVCPYVGECNTLY